MATLKSENDASSGIWLIGRQPSPAVPQLLPDRRAENAILREQNDTVNTYTMQLKTTGYCDLSSQLQICAPTLLFDLSSAQAKEIEGYEDAVRHLTKIFGSFRWREVVQAHLSPEAIMARSIEANKPTDQLNIGGRPIRLRP